MGDAHEELLNIYDDEANVVSRAPRRAAKASGRAVGAVNLLLVNRRGEVLLQKRPVDKENGGRWDKSVGGHVAAGEGWDETALRETSEELFGVATSPRAQLVPSREALVSPAQPLDLEDGVAFYRASLQRGLRDVRHVPGGGLRNVVYHVAIYLGRTETPLDRFCPQREEIDALRYASSTELDRMLLRGELAPNMAFLWLTHARPLLGLVG